MDIPRILIAPPTKSHPPKSSAGNSASNPRPVAKTTSPSTRSINIHKTTAMIDEPVPELDAIAEGALPYEGFHELYDDSRQNSPEVNAGPAKGLPTLPPIKKNNGRSEPPNVESLPRIRFSANSQLIDTSPAAPTSGVSVHGTTSTSSRDWPRKLVLSPGTTSLITSPRPKTAARSSNRIPDDAEIFDVDTWEPRRCMQVTHPSSGSRTGSNAKSKDGNPFPGQQTESWFYIDIDTARQTKIDVQLGAALFCDFANDCHKRNEIRQGKQRKDEALSPLVPSIEENSSIECEACDEDAANVKYIYNVRECTQTCYGDKLKAIKAHPGNAVWPLVESRLGFVNDPRKWETACNRCPSEQREQTIPLEEAAVDDKKNRIEGAAPYNPDFYTTTSSMRELRVKAEESWAELEHRALSANFSSPSPSAQAPSPGSIGKGKQKVNGDGNSNESQPTPRIASARATTSRSRNMAMREANGNINSNASETQARPPPPPPPPTRSSRRNRHLAALEPRVPPLPPAPAASSSRRSQRHSDAVAAHAPDPVTHSTPPATAPRSEGSSERRGRLRLHVAAEANPEHPGHEAYLARGQLKRKRGKE